MRFEALLQKTEEKGGHDTIAMIRCYTIDYDLWVVAGEIVPWRVLSRERLKVQGHKWVHMVLLLCHSISPSRVIFSDEQDLLPFFQPRLGHSLASLPGTLVTVMPLLAAVSPGLTLRSVPSSPGTQLARLRMEGIFHMAAFPWAPRSGTCWSLCPGSTIP